MSVNISYNNSLHSYSVTPAMLVKNLIEEISEKQSLFQIKLKHGDIELLEMTHVKKYLITQFTLCYDDKKVPVEINNMTFDVMITTPDDRRSLKEKASPEMTIGALKEKISKKFISTQGNWVLKKGQAVPDKDLLKSHMVKKTFTVHFEDMTVIIKDDNRTFTITTRGDMTILQFKRHCSKKKKWDSNFMGLLFNGEILEDESEEGQERTVGSYQIKPSSVIKVISLLPGADSGQL